METEHTYIYGHSDDIVCIEGHRDYDNEYVYSDGQIVVGDVTLYAEYDGKWAFHIVDDGDIYTQVDVHPIDLVDEQRFNAYTEVVKILDRVNE